MAAMPARGDGCMPCRVRPCEPGVVVATCSSGPAKDSLQIQARGLTWISPSTHLQLAIQLLHHGLLPTCPEPQTLLAICTLRMAMPFLLCCGGGDMSEFYRTLQVTTFL
jgi:hypothetical protein